MNPEDQNYKKSILFKIGIIVIILAILFLWLASLRGVFESNQINSNQSFEKIKEDLGKSLIDAEEQFNQTASSTNNSFVKDLIDKASSTATSTLSTSTATLELKEELTGLIKTATTTPKRISCPEYINCMPSIGEARPCVIPAGCENITQIAY